MSVSAGTGGVSVVGAVIGSGAGAHAGAKVLPFTGASHVVDLVALAMVLILAGILILGLARRPSDSESP